jgi:hypothetical protein
MQKLRQYPILILLIVNILVGLSTFRDYGLSWDEPLFYDYADALRYAYSPREWVSGDFDLNNAFGSSGADHANRGPAYIILARPLVSVVESLGADNASAWHLINFLTFQLGVYLLYRFAKRYMSESAALASAALFAWQPLLWGHAFINPKDIPFLVFFLGAVCFGFEMVDSAFVSVKLDADSRRQTQIEKEKSAKSASISVPIKIFLSSFFLGVATSIRVLGPLAGVLVGLYALARLKEIAFPRFVKFFALYAVLAILFAVALWPYLWANPVQRFLEAFGFMSDNPTQLPVLFNGQIYPADQLPRRYLPVLLALTLTEPVLPLFLIGLFFAFLRPKPSFFILYSAFCILLWLLIPFAYVLLLRPPMYDGYRHFLFMLPPLFVFAGFAFERVIPSNTTAEKNAVQSKRNKTLPQITRIITNCLKNPCKSVKFVAKTFLDFLFLSSREAAKNLKIAIILFLILLPSLYVSSQLHPYQYAYYNSYIGGTSGAFRAYETEYWLTCYKEAVENFESKNVNLFVKREPYIAATYANGINIRDYRAEFGKITTGDYVLVNTRTNEDLKTFRDAPVVLKISRGDAVFCEVKQIP